MTDRVGKEPMSDNERKNGHPSADVPDLMALLRAELEAKIAARKARATAHTRTPWRNE